jgi:hypothetical protein
LSGNLAVPGIEHGTSGSVAKNSDQQTTEAVVIMVYGSVNAYVISNKYSEY